VPTSLAIALQGWGTTQRRPLLSPQFDKTGLSAAPKTVLVVDDDRGVRRLTARMLRLEGFKVIEAASGAEALRALDSDPDVDLLVTDIVMPEMHGLELADLALARIPKLRVVLMTGHAPELTKQLELRDSRFPVLLKPFSAEQLIARVREVLALDG
jgi:DNA-binding NtrC family response regulator